jgi:hypothetical protein
LGLGRQRRVRAAGVPEHVEADDEQQLVGGWEQRT